MLIASRVRPVGRRCNEQQRITAVGIRWEESYTLPTTLATPMTEKNTPSQDSGSKEQVAAEEPELQDQVDALLDEVEALTEEALTEVGGAEQEDASARPATVPNSDPARAVIADDVGLTDQSPLIQEGDRIPVEEVVADVDHELDQMEKLIGGGGGTKTPTVRSHIDEASSADEEAVAAPDDEATAREEKALRTLEPNDWDPESTSAEGAGAGNTVASEGTDAVAADIPAQTAATLDDEVASQIPSTPEDSTSVLSREEQSLDGDIDALLAAGQASEDKELTDELVPEASSAVEEAKPESARREADRDQQTETGPQLDWESISVWQLLKARVLARSKHLLSLLVERLVGRFVRILEGIDALVGHRFSPAVRELIGYCALGTLAMCLVGIIIALWR